MKQEIPGVPSECPPPSFYLDSPRRPRLLYYRFPAIPGVPEILDSPSARFVAARAGNEGANLAQPRSEWLASLAAIGGEFDRADYHLSRFHSVLETIKDRRRVLGGPVVGDFAPARALYCEASAYLSAIRTVVDIVVDTAARRAGHEPRMADKWDATDAIAPNPDKKIKIDYGTDDINALRKHRPWFETLNLYRNSMAHRGWHERSFGYFSKADTAPESDDPLHNVMLVPDRSSLRYARPDKWTYTKRTWLDELVAEISTGVEPMLVDLCAVWQLSKPARGTVPDERRPTVVLTVPRAVSLETGKRPSVIHVFESKPAIRAFFSHFKQHNQVLINVVYRAVRPTIGEGGQVGFIFAYDAEDLGEDAEVHFMSHHLGQPTIAIKARLADSQGPVPNTFWFHSPGFKYEAIYLLDVKAVDADPE